MRRRRPRPAPPLQPAKAPTTEDVIARPASVSRQRRTIGGQAVRLSRRAARLDRRVVHGGLHGRAGAAEGSAMTSLSRRPPPTDDAPRRRGRPNPPPPDGRRTRRTAPCSTRSPPSTRPSTATGWCRRTRLPTSTAWCRPRWPSTATGVRAPSQCSRPRSVDPPLPAAGYQLPIEVDNPTDAANLAVRMEEDAAVAWRAVLEQATDEQDRAFAVTALTQCAVDSGPMEPGAGHLADHRRLPRRFRVTASSRKST